MESTAKTPAHYPHPLTEAALALIDNRLSDAELRLKTYLKEDPFDVRAIRMLAELAGRIGRYRDAESLLRCALELAPLFTPARANLALVLYRLNRPADALAELDRVVSEDADNPGHANLQAAAFGRIGQFDEAIALYEHLLAEVPEQPRVWMSYGHMLKTVGRQSDGIAAYRRAIALLPSLGEAWWSLANLKTVSFTSTDLLEMEAGLGKSGIAEEDRFHLEFALGKALEDRGRPAEAFDRYRSANARRRTLLPYNASDTTALVDRYIARFDRSFFDRVQQGCSASDSIFIIGMPRAGSTLIEQILSSHSQIEGTGELADIPMLARRDGGGPDGVETWSEERLRATGEEYLERTRVHRHTERPFFIDKLPNNWLHAGFIHCILPNAHIIDVRRHPLGCCFSNFKQHFARGQAFSYDLSDMGRYYRDYVRLMDHFDTVLPNRIQRVYYEDVVNDTERTVRKLLDGCGLAFESACLAFYETDRAVRTPSSEQVRQPIFREGTQAWRPFEPWLDPLKAALGDALTTYPHTSED